MSKGKTLLQRAATDWKQAGKPRGDIIVKGPSTADLIRAELAPVADTIRAQQAEIDDMKGQAIRTAAEIAGKLKLTQQEQRVFDALLATAGNELAAAESLSVRCGKTKPEIVKVTVNGKEREVKRIRPSGVSRSNVQRIRAQIEAKIGATGYSNPRTFWRRAHPLAHTAPERVSGRNTGTLPVR